jgi:hypothetical protein
VHARATRALETTTGNGRSTRARTSQSTLLYMLFSSSTAHRRGRAEK